MRGSWLIVAGICVFGCKDKETPKSTQATPGSATSLPTSTAQPQPPPAAPKLDLDEAFKAETEDKVWADATEKSIKAVAPDLADVTCLQHQCRATVIAASDAELVAKVEALQSESALRGLDHAKNVLLTAAEQRDGKLAMKIYVRFDR